MTTETSNEFIAEDRPECPHYEQDSEWQTEMWRDLKTTGYEIRVCRNCGFKVERRPLKALTDIVLPRLGQTEYSPNVFDTIAGAVLGLDAKRFEDITEDTPQEVSDGKSETEDTPSA